MIRIPNDDPALDVWKTVLRIAKLRPRGWTLIGAQMVALHGLEHDRQPPRPSTDADLLVNARTLGEPLKSFALFLEDQGLKLTGASQDGIGHRFSDGVVSVDLLGPDGLSRSSALITIPPARTVQVPGGTQALKRSERVDVNAGGMSANLVQTC